MVRDEPDDGPLGDRVLELNPVDADRHEVHVDLQEVGGPHVGLLVEPLQQGSPEEEPVVVQVLGPDKPR